LGIHRRARRQTPPRSPQGLEFPLRLLRSSCCRCAFPRRLRCPPTRTGRSSETDGYGHFRSARRITGRG
jgi:hypothetical protein